MSQASETDRRLRALTPADAEALEAILAARAGGSSPLRPELAARAADLQHVLDALEVYPVVDPSPELLERALARVREVRQGQRFNRQIEDLAGPRVTFGLFEALTLTVSLLIVVALALPMLALNQDRARRMACAASLHATGAAFGAYAADYEQFLPRGPVVPGQPWYAVGSRPAADGSFRSNSQHLRLIARHGYVDLRLVGCPENPYTLRDPDPAALDWQRHEQVPFSYQNQFTRRAVRVDAQPRLVVLGDKNPLFLIQPGRPLALRGGAVPDQPCTYRSAQMHRDGQNVLAADGTVRWEPCPILPNGDNIWAVLGVSSYNGTESPTTLDDSHLIP